MSSQHNRACGFCKHTNAAVMECEKCGKLLPIGEGEDYFTLFNLDEAEVDPTALDNSYYKLSSLYHPDKFVSHSSPEQVIANANSEVINKAYRILKDDMSRWHYLLEKHNADPDLHEGNTNLLEEVMHWNLRLGDEKPEELRQEFSQKQEYLTKEIRNKLANSLYLEAKKDYIMLKYLKRFLAKIDEAISNK